MRVKSSIYKVTLLTLVSVVGAAQSFAQMYPERRLIRSGNKEYERKNYVESEIAYRRALEKAPASRDANYNLAGSLYQQGRFGEAAQLYSQIAADSTQTIGSAFNTFYNTGNALFKERKFNEAIEAYKQALRLNPNDMEAKFNLAYAKKMIDDNKDKNDQNKDNKDNKQNQDNKDNKQNQNDQNKQDQNNSDKDKQDQNQDQNKDNPDQNKQDQQQTEGGMNKNEADQMLDAVQQSEDKTRDKMKEKKAKVIGRSGKNW